MAVANTICKELKMEKNNKPGELKINGAAAQNKQKVKSRKKPKRLSRQLMMKIVAMVLVIAFLGGVVGTTAIYLLGRTSQTPGSNIIQYNAIEDLEKERETLEAAYEKDEEDNDSLLQLINIYSELGYSYRGEGDEEKAVSYFLKAAERSLELKENNPAMATSADYLIAGNYAEAGKLDEAEAIIRGVVDKGSDPLTARIIYAEFLINKRQDQAGANAQIDAALAAATSDGEREYVESLVEQYKLR